MAVGDAFMPIDMPDSFVWYGSLLESTASRIVIDDGFRRTEYIGDFTYPGGISVAGELEAIREYRGGDPFWTVTEIGADAAAVFEAIQLRGDYEMAARLHLAGDDTGYGSSGADVVRLYDGDDTGYGGGGSDRLFGGRGRDALHGGDGRDELFGGLGKDRAWGGDGCDWLSGGKGGDRLYGQKGGDTLIGGPGGDTIKGGGGDDRGKGGAGADHLAGGCGRDKLAGGGGNDFLKGGGGRDTLKGGRGDDVLEGGAGRDVLKGGAGDDVLKGGGGADRFVFREGDDRDRIRDFQDDRDAIDLRHHDLASRDATGRPEGRRRRLRFWGRRPSDRQGCDRGRALRRPDRLTDWSG